MSNRCCDVSLSHQLHLSEECRARDCTVAGPFPTRLKTTCGGSLLGTEGGQLDWKATNRILVIQDSTDRRDANVSPQGVCDNLINAHECSCKPSERWRQPSQDGCTGLARKESAQKYGRAQKVHPGRQLVSPPNPVQCYEGGLWLGCARLCGIVWWKEVGQVISLSNDVDSTVPAGSSRLW